MFEGFGSFCMFRFAVAMKHVQRYKALELEKLQLLERLERLERLEGLQ